MNDIERILAIVGIIWLAHIPFVIPFILAGTNLPERAKKGAKRSGDEAGQESEKTLARAS